MCHPFCTFVWILGGMLLNDPLIAWLFYKHDAFNFQITNLLSPIRNILPLLHKVFSFAAYTIRQDMFKFDRCIIIAVIPLAYELHITCFVI